MCSLLGGIYICTLQAWHMILRIFAQYRRFSRKIIWIWYIKHFYAEVEKYDDWDTGCHISLPYSGNSTDFSLRYRAVDTLSFLTYWCQELLAVVWNCLSLKLDIRLSVFSRLISWNFVSGRSRKYPKHIVSICHSIIRVCRNPQLITSIFNVIYPSGNKFLFV